MLGLWILLGLETGLFVSRGLFVSVCPPGTSARFWNVPGAGAFGGFDSPAGLRLRLLLLLARDVQSAVPSLRSSVVYAPYRRRSECAVCCFRCLWVWGILVALIRLVGFLVGLRLRASPSAPSGPPEATTRLRTHGRCPGSFPDSPQNTHGTPRSYLPRNTAVRRFGALPVAFVVLHLCTSSPPSPLPLSLPFKLLRRHQRARARGAARRHAMGGYYRDRDRGSDRDRRPADREESSDLRRRSGGATRCSAVTRDGGGCGMAAAAGRGCHAAARVVVALA